MHSFYHFFTEMAQPSEKEKSTRWYHGTSEKAKGESILKDGVIKAPDLSLRPNTWTRPVSGRTYVTPSINYVMSYMLGGNLAGDKYFEVGHHGEQKYKKEPFGYLFVINGNELTDVLPDEDAIGEQLFTLWRLKFKPHPNSYAKPTPLETRFFNFAERNLSPKILHYVFEGEYIWWAKAGKILLHKMPGDMIRWFLDKKKSEDIPGYSNKGNLPFKEAWKFDKILTKKLTHDGSNFFELAERIK